MRPRPQEVWSVGAAIALHVGALWVLRVTLGEGISSGRATTASRPELSFDIELGEGFEAGTASAIEHDAPHVGAERVARFVGRARARETTSERVEPEAVGSAETETEELAVDLEDSPPEKPIELGIGPDGWRRWVTVPKAGEAPRADRPSARANRFQVFRAPPVSTTGGLQEGLEESDRALGLGPAGRVLSALHNAAHTTAAPQVGTARFDVTVLRTGVVEVKLGAASGEVEQWRKVATHIADELRSAPPRITPPREGVKLVVELVAEETMPNGTKLSSLEGPHLDVAPPKLQSTQRSAEQLGEDNPTAKNPTAETLPPIKLDLPGVYLTERGKVCSYRLGLSPLGPVFQGGCDPSNIGAKPQRMVRARVVEQSMF